MVGIYKVTSPSGKIYIGQSSNIELRFIYYKRLSCKSQLRLYNSFLKYGVLQHKFEIIEECELQELNYKERYYQDLYNVLGRGGLNLTLTKANDRKCVHSDETIKRISQSNKGRKHTEQSKRKMAIARTGEKNHFFNRHHSCETKAKISEQHKGMKYSEETNKKKGSVGTKNGWAKTVLNLETGIFYDCVREAAESIGANHRTLANKLRGSKRNNTSFIYV